MQTPSKPNPAARSQCVILYFAEGWRLMLDGQKRGRFDYQVDATEAALKLARAGRAVDGRAVDVWVQDRFGELQPLATDQVPASTSIKPPIAA